MVNWTSPGELQKEQVAYVNVIFASFGLYIWEIFQTSDFELAVLQRRRKLQWHWVIFLFLCRYSLVLSLSALMSSFTVKTAINCQALYTFICVTGNISIVCSSTTLLFRTLAVWERKLPITVALGILCLAHWALLWRGMFIMTAEYSAPTMSCVVTTTNRLFLGITFWATMGFNLIITVAHIVGLLRRDHGASVWEMLFDDGVIYYLAAFSCNALPAILNALNLNPIMNLIATVPAAVMSAVAACRTVTRLADVDEDDDAYVHSATQLATPRSPGAAALRFRNNRYPAYPQVHVTTDHIVMQDFQPSPTSMVDKPESLVAEENKSCHAV